MCSSDCVLLCSFVFLRVFLGKGIREASLFPNSSRELRMKKMEPRRPGKSAVSAFAGLRRDKWNENEFEREKWDIRGF